MNLILYESNYILRNNIKDKNLIILKEIYKIKYTIIRIINLFYNETSFIK